MGVFTFEDETVSVVPPAKLFKGLVTDADTIIPKVVDAIKSVEIVEGNGGPGSIKKLTFVEDGETKHVLHKTEAIDEVNYEYKYSVVGGVGLPESFEKVLFEGKLVEGPNGGSIAKVSVKYFSKGDSKPTEDEIKTGKARDNALFKAIEGYVLANPAEY